MMEIFYILTVVMVAWVYLFVKIHWTADLKQEHFIICKLYLKRLFIKIKKCMHCMCTKGNNIKWHDEQHKSPPCNCYNSLKTYSLIWTFFFPGFFFFLNRLYFLEIMFPENWADNIENFPLLLTSCIMVVFYNWWTNIDSLLLTKPRVNTRVHFLCYTVLWL